MSNPENEKQAGGGTLVGAFKLKVGRKVLVLVYIHIHNPLIKPRRVISCRFLFRLQDFLMARIDGTGVSTIAVYVGSGLSLCQSSKPGYIDKYLSTYT